LMIVVDGFIVNNLDGDMCFFFFQAEDGIRDRNVTGVQTCALPIFGLLWLLGRRRPPATAPDHRGPAMTLTAAPDQTVPPDDTRTPAPHPSPARRPSFALLALALGGPRIGAAASATMGHPPRLAARL